MPAINEIVTIIICAAALIVAVAIPLWIHLRERKRQESNKKSKKPNDEKYSTDLNELIKIEENNVSIRQREKEVYESNKFFQAATSARIIAMTYKTLGNAISNFRFEKLQDAEICVYALPNLSFNHPTLHGNYAGLELEWTKGVESTIRCFLESKKCPNLTHLDITVFSAMPFLTGTDVKWTDNGKQRTRLRMTFLNAGIEPMDNPTFVLSEQVSINYGHSIFITFKKMMDNVGGKSPAPLKFVIKRPHFERSNISGFVSNLKLVCNHPKMCAQDRLFEVGLQCENCQLNCNDSLDSFTASKIIKEQNQISKLHINWNNSNNNLIISNCDTNKAAMVHLKLSHIFASFGILVYHNKVVMVDNSKEGWQYDVPGGKISNIDRSELHALRREIFEELAFLIKLEKVSEPLGFIYDPKSSRENHSPVIAQYYQYNLDEEEYKFLFEIVKVCTKGNELILYPLDRLIDQKNNKREGEIEPLCHVPLSVLKQITVLPQIN